MAKEFDIREARRRLEKKLEETKWWQIRRRWEIKQALEMLDKLEALQWLGVDIKFVEKEEEIERIPCGETQDEKITDYDILQAIRRGAPDEFKIRKALGYYDDEEA